MVGSVRTQLKAYEKHYALEILARTVIEAKALCGRTFPHVAGECQTRGYAFHPAQTSGPPCCYDCGQGMPVTPRRVGSSPPSYALYDRYAANPESL